MPSETRGRDLLYVLRTAGPEDLLKVGITNNPLVRWSSFHIRWFEAFDLADSVLVEAERRIDAQALETSLHRRLSEHSCPIPLTMRLAAGGETEWYRGADLPVRQFIAECRAAGIRPVMVTGDHAATARAIAERLGFARTQRVITGHELERLSDAALSDAPPWQRPREIRRFDPPLSVATGELTPKGTPRRQAILKRRFRS